MAMLGDAKYSISFGVANVDPEKVVTRSVSSVNYYGGESSIEQPSALGGDADLFLNFATDMAASVMGGTYSTLTAKLSDNRDIISE